MSIEAYAIIAICIESALRCSSDASVFHALSRGHESLHALANGLAVNDIAKGVTTARIFTGVNTSSILANGVYGAVFVGGAMTLELAALTASVRVAHVVRCALADGTVRGPGHAHSARVAGIWVTDLDGCALDVSHRVWFETRRTLANGSVVVSDADRVKTTGVLVTGVVARMLQQIAELRGRAVDVVDTGHSLAAPRRVVWIAGVQARRALAVGNVVAHNTQSVWPTGQEVTHRLAR